MKQHVLASGRVQRALHNTQTLSHAAAHLEQGHDVNLLPSLPLQRVWPLSLAARPREPGQCCTINGQRRTSWWLQVLQLLLQPLQLMRTCLQQCGGVSRAV